MTGSLCENDAPSSAMRGERALWRAVIMQALIDAASNSAKMEARYEKAQALCWLTGYGEDFKTVCDLANYPPDYIRSRSADAIARNCRWRSDSATQSPSRLREGLGESVGMLSPSEIHLHHPPHPSPPPQAGEGVTSP